MKAYKLEVLIINHDQMDEGEIISVLENANYPNDCVSPRVMRSESVDIGEWHDDHPLNARNCFEAYEELFEK